MSQCIVPNWNLRNQRQKPVEGGESNRSSHVNNNNNYNQQQQQQQEEQHNPISSHHLFPMSDYDIAELTWQNGQLAMHGLGGLLPTAPTKPTWGRSNETLESIVNQATCHKQGDQPLSLLQHHHNNPPNLTSMVASSAGKLSESSSGRVQMVPGLKRTRVDSDQCMHDDRADISACASGSATFCRDSDTTMMTWASYESPRSLKTKTLDDDSACHVGLENQDEDRETKAETGRSHSSRRSRAAAVHNQSERRRRDRINQKMKALQKLVPNASKTDKASMLDYVIDYLKQLQAQVQMMISVNRNMPQMMMPLGMQQHIQMSLLARMGMGVGLGMGMGMLDMNTAAISRGPPQPLPPLIHPPPVSSTTPTFVPSPFLMPSMIPTACPPPPQPNSETGETTSSVPLTDPYYAFLAQSMNMELYNKMAALYRQQVNQGTQATSDPSQSNHAQSD